MIIIIIKWMFDGMLVEKSWKKSSFEGKFCIFTQCHKTFLTKLNTQSKVKTKSNW